MTPTTLAETVVLVLEHSLWQALLVTVIAAWALRVISARHPELRYGIAGAAYLAIVLSACVTASLVQLVPEPVPTAALPRTSAAQAPAVGTAAPAAEAAVPGAAAIESRSSNPATTTPPGESVESSRQSTSRRVSASVAPFLALAWLLGATLMLIRGLTGQVVVHHWKVDAVPLNDDQRWLTDLLETLCRELRIRGTVALRLSSQVTTPAVVGLLHSGILIPPALLTGLSPDQWRIVLAHELAHIRRWDALANLFQTVVDSLLFFNPALHWLSRVVRVEREACCDALAARSCGPAVSVARTLVDVAASAQPTPVAVSPALAFAEPSESGELTDRVTRLVHPDQAPRPRLSWSSSGAALSALLLLLIMVYRGTDLVVRAAADWMSPRDRVSALATLEAQRNGNVVPDPARPPQTDNPSPTDEAEPGRIPVHVVVKTSDGSPVQRTLSLMSLSFIQNHSSGKTLNVPREDVAEFRTTLYYPPCQFRIGAQQPGRAPVITPVQTLMADDPERTVTLELTPGISREILIRDPAGQPVPYAALQLSSNLAIRGSKMGLITAEAKADAAGRVRVEHLGHASYSIRVAASGFQRSESTAELVPETGDVPESPYSITLKPARAATLQIRNAEGQPVVGASVRAIHVKQQNHSSHFGSVRDLKQPSRWTEYAVSDATGLARIDELTDDSVYTFLVLAPDFGAEQVSLEPGQQASVTMAPPVTLRGQLTGALDRLRREGERPGAPRQVSVSARPNSPAPENLWIRLDDEGRFEIPDRSVGEELVLALPDESRVVRVAASMAPLDFKIAPAVEPATGPMREVSLEFTGVLPEAPARGVLKAGYDYFEKGITHQQRYPVRIDRISFPAPVGSTVWIEDEGLVGYRFSEPSRTVVTAGDGPQFVAVKVVASGGIHGTIRRADGSPADSGFITVFAMRVPRGFEQPLNPSSQSASPQFLRNVPLGGSYRLLARESTPGGLAWTVSEELTINEETPIREVTLTLPQPRPLDLHFVDPSGRPVPGQNVDIELAFHARTDSKSGFSMRVPARSDSAGRVDAPIVTTSDSQRAVEVVLSAIVKPGPMRGDKVTIPASGSGTLTLKAGVRSHGVVIDSVTDKPIPQARVRIFPRHFQRAEFRESVETQTDAKGEFVFDGLEAIEYSAYVEDTSPEGTVITPIGASGLRINTPPGAGHSLVGGSEMPVRWRVVIHPRSKLAPLQ